MKHNYLLLQIILTIALAINTVIISTVITYNLKPLYYYDIKSLNISHASGLSVADIKNNYNYIIAYLNGNTSSNFKLPTLKSSTDGKIHFSDVRVLLDNLKVIAICCSVIIFISFLLIKKKRDLLYIKLSSIFILSFALILMASVQLFKFNNLFLEFHKIAFKNTFWIFNASSDPVILMLPEAFFMHCAFLILILSMFLSIIYLLLYKAAAVKLNLVGKR